jgi:tryptophan-rich sensory protein
MLRTIVLRSLFWIVLSFVAAAIGGIGTAIGLGPWYEGLNKPALAPPNWVFGPVWTTLYTLMGIAMGLMDSETIRPESRQENRRIRIVFAVQLFLNALWPLTFFAAGQLWLGVLVIVALEAAIATWISLGWRISRPATVLIFPYAAWVAFATYLNVSFAVLN